MHMVRVFVLRKEWLRIWVYSLFTEHRRSDTLAAKILTFSIFEQNSAKIVHTHKSVSKITVQYLFSNINIRNMSTEEQKLCNFLTNA